MGSFRVAVRFGFRNEWNHRARQRAGNTNITSIASAIRPHVCYRNLLPLPALILFGLLDLRMTTIKTPYPTVSGGYMLERSNRTRIFATLVLLASLSPLQGQKGYDLRDNQVLVDTRRHWEDWKRPTHLSRIDSDGAVRPRSFRGVYDVLTDVSFGRPVQLSRDAPRIFNIDSTMKVDVRGNPIRDLTGNLLYDYVVRPGASRAGSNLHLAKTAIRAPSGNRTLTSRPTNGGSK